MPQSLSEWLAHVERVHTKPIELGLERVRSVLDRLDLPAKPPVITVAGTNGKGSTCAMLERILLVAGYRVGLYTSPHLLHYNERVRIDGSPAADEVLCRGFAAVEAVRGDVPLTYFEFGTLCAWHAFAHAPLDVLILEVGMGGRLDAVNAVDADCAILTSIDLDHMEFLGDTREAIGHEKAGVLRAGRPAIIADPAPPQSVIEYAQRIGAQLRCSGRDFGFGGDRSQWQYWSRRGEAIRRRGGIAYPALRGANQLLNAAGVIAALEAMESSLPVSMQHIRRGLMELDLPGRFQVLPGRPTVVLDVAHNPHAAAVLADNLGNMGFHPNTWAVFGMLRDKDVEAVVRHLRPRVDYWLPCSLEGPRGADSAQIAAVLARAGAQVAGSFEAPAAAYAHARERAGQDDRILVFGSFLTVADVMRTLSSAKS
jgi:dihydrofolate synthase/folylpolyglutamate synthase